MRKNISNSEKISESNPFSINRVVRPEKDMEENIFIYIQNKIWKHILDHNF